MPGGARVLAALLLVFGAAATSRAQSSPDRVRFLDVPYIQQSEALCGGAAAAMVMRYWGATGVYAETFAPLVDRDAGGIRGEDLLAALRERGWDARSFRGDAALLRARLADGQPVIALIEDRPGTFHYVVVVAWTNGRVVLHDPARAPYRVLPEVDFNAAWAKSQYWTMLALPGTAAPAPDETKTERPLSVSACDPLVAQGVAAANAGDLDDALRTLAGAAAVCPQASAPWREMAGVYAVREQWRDAAAHAREAVRRDRQDTHAWRILATSSFVTDDVQTALEAWNEVGEPILDIVNVRGLRHTRHAAATAAMRLTPQTVLTAPALAAAARRLADVPAAQLGRVSYRPLENGRVAVDAVLIERSRSPFSAGGLAMMGIRALTEREIAASVANPTGAGDLASVSWRWWERRPRLAASYAAPLARGGVLRVEAFRDEQTYRGDVRELRRGGAVSLSDWTRGQLHWTVAAGADAWRGQGRTFALGFDLDQRLARDRVSLQAGASALGGSFSTWTATTAVEWRTSPRHEGHVLLARGGLDLAGRRAPLALWSGAGIGHARRALLRAHPLLDDGVMAGDVFGRRLYSASTEWRRWSRPMKTAIRFAPAVFVDAARAERRLAEGAAWHADAGIGLRIAIPGANVLRLDVARGLRDGRTQFSVGFTR